ncbi:GNAT family N-acetyltransferase [Micromonospora sp. 15K316]|uniref:GNAT family N-acetyltransferase n=1 Tax=Micromonospora sp. 15K316 TaxID=2530376 RepID=UPI001043C369|nr:GNAT family N-acetyltransferase [Micromonospora sp. 15K316]TDC34944.1 GNAT family N-acetyltransferase [Micromonospora sp. 15K316]
MDSIVQRSVVAQLTRRPQVVEIGPFVLGWDPTTESPHINYATPQPDAAITGADVEALVAAFRDIRRIPRLEYVTACAPGLEAQLRAAGFTVEARHDYLVCSPGALAVPAAPDGVELAVPATDGDRAAVVAAQNEAFGGEAVATAADVARIRRLQEIGAPVLSARTAEGECVGGGQASVLGAGVSEVGGIAVRAAYRRRGIAGALTAAITERVFAAGGEHAWLEASGPDSWRVYERVGYRPVGKRLYLRLG